MEKYGLTINSKYFKFKIEKPSNPFEAGSEDYAKSEGFIDAMKSFDYLDFEENKGTLEEYTAKSLGYIRWLSLCTALSNFGIFFLEVDTLEGASALTTPSSIEFTIGYEQPEAMYFKTKEGVEYKGIDVLKYITAFVMSHQYKSFVQVFDPSPRNWEEKPGVIYSTLANGIYDKFLTAGKLCKTLEDAYQYITITEVNGPDGDETVSV